MSSKTKLLLGISIGVVVVATIVFFLFFYQARLTILATPPTAEVLIDGQPAASGTAIKLNPGQYEITVRGSGFLTQKQTIDLKISDVRNLPITLASIPSIKPITQDVQFPDFTDDGEAIVYLGNAGKQFFKVGSDIGADGKAQKQPISTERFSGVRNVFWSFDKNLALIQTTDNKTKLFDFKRYDFLTQEEKELSGDLRSVAWSPKANEFIGFLSAPSGERSLIRQEIATGKIERLIDLRPQQLTNPDVRWSPNGRQAILTENEVHLIDLATKEIRVLAGTQGAIAARWSPTSSAILVEKEDGLVVVPLTGDPKALGVKTDINKTIWSADGSRVIVGIPTDQGRDLISEITVATGQESSYSYSASASVNIQQPMVDNETKILWFLNANTLTRLSIEREIP